MSPFITRQVEAARRTNYAIIGNTGPALHTHIVPFFDWEQENIRRGLPRSWDQTSINARMFEPKRGLNQIQQIELLIHIRL